MSLHEVQPETERATSTTPPPTSNELAPTSPSESTIGRKREREGSLEPTTPGTSGTATQRRVSGHVPAKKNRTLGTTSEEESSPPPLRTPSPPAADSPAPVPDTVSVLRIRKKVKEMSWAETEEEDAVGSFTADKDDAHSVTPTELNDDRLEEDPKLDPLPEDTSPDAVASAAQSQGAKDDATAPSPYIKIESTAGANPPPASPSPSSSRSQSPRASDPEAIPVTDKSLKRKSRDNSTLGAVEEPATEPHKRQRDAEPSRASAGPSKPRTRPSSPSARPAIGGFAAFATKPSPFLTVGKGASVFDSASTSSTSSSKANGFAAFTNMTPFSKLAASSSSNSPTPSTPSESDSAPKPAFNGFAAFASAPSPFLTYGKPASSSSTPPVSTRPKVGEAFGAFSNAAAGFVVPKPSASPQEEGTGNDESEKPAADFSDILAEKGEENVVEKTKYQQKAADELISGEEDENTLLHAKMTLLYLDRENHSYEKRAFGVLKLNVKKDDGSAARIIMRQDLSGKVVLNTSLKGMRSSLYPDGKGVIVPLVTEKGIDTYLLRGNEAKAKELFELIQAHDGSRLAPSSQILPSSDEEDESPV